jgi:hypothetical protein
MPFCPFQIATLITRATTNGKPAEQSSLREQSKKAEFK